MGKRGRVSERLLVRLQEEFPGRRVDGLRKPDDRSLVLCAMWQGTYGRLLDWWSEWPISTMHCPYTVHEQPTGFTARSQRTLPPSQLAAIERKVHHIATSVAKRQTVHGRGRPNADSPDWLLLIAADMPLFTSQAAVAAALMRPSAASWLLRTHCLPVVSVSLSRMSSRSRWRTAHRIGLGVPGVSEDVA